MKQISMFDYWKSPLKIDKPIRLIELFAGVGSQAKALQRLGANFEHYKKYAKHKPHGEYGTVYCLTNFGSTMEENLYRIYTLRELGYSPYVMIYDKPHAPREIRLLQRWCNNRIIFKSCPRFEDYDPKKG